MTIIEASTFKGCIGLAGIDIPASVTTIGHAAFSDCSNLTMIGIPDSVTEIEGSAFSVCTSIESIEFPDALISIGDLAFSGCSALKYVTLPNSVLSIGESAFSGCNGLESVVLSKSLTTIGRNAFGGCTNIQDIYYGADEPVEFSYSKYPIFPVLVCFQATLWVQEGAVERCRQIEPWCKFNNIKPYDFAGVEEIGADWDADAPFEVYDLNGVKYGTSTEGLAPGIYILRQGGKVKKIAIK